MPFTADVSDADVLSDQTGALFALSVKLAAHRAQLEAQVQNKPLPGYRGTTVASVSDRSLSVKAEDGSVKQVALTPARARQLLEPAVPRGPK